MEEQNNKTAKFYLINALITAGIVLITLSLFSFFQIDNKIDDLAQATLYKDEVKATAKIDEQILSEAVDKGIQKFVANEQQKQADQQKKAQEDANLSRATLPKTNVPKVELFTMSHCPFGTQIEKGFLTVLDALKDKIDFKIKFVNYAMHGETEIQEQLAQYCLMEQYPQKYLPYLQAFLDTGDQKTSLAKQGLSDSSIANCMKATDEKYKIMESFNNRDSWRTQYPPFDIYNADNEKYGVRGSPTLVINGRTIETQRDSKSLLETVCLGFTNKPEECNKVLASAEPSSGFGYKTGYESLKTAQLDCGQY